MDSDVAPALFDDAKHRGQTQARALLLEGAPRIGVATARTYNSQRAATGSMASHRAFSQGGKVQLSRPAFAPGTASGSQALGLTSSSYFPAYNCWATVVP
jgi:hypothetical protein